MNIGAGQLRGDEFNEVVPQLLGEPSRDVGFAAAERTVSEDEHKRTRYLTPEEENRLFQVVPEEPHPLLIVALNAGLRKTEQLSLTWDDIDFQQGLIRVKRSRSGKTRFVPMRSIVIETLKSVPRMIDNPYIFFGRSNGTRLQSM